MILILVGSLFCRIYVFRRIFVAYACFPAFQPAPSSLSRALTRVLLTLKDLPPHLVRRVNSQDPKFARVVPSTNVMHCPWTRKTRAWGYEVVRAIDEDDGPRVIRAFRHPTELTFVDLDTQVGRRTHESVVWLLQEKYPSAYSLQGGCFR